MQLFFLILDFVNNLLCHNFKLPPYIPVRKPIPKGFLVPTYKSVQCRVLLKLCVEWWKKRGYYIASDLFLFIKLQCKHSNKKPLHWNRLDRYQKALDNIG